MNKNTMKVRENHLHMNKNNEKYSYFYAKITYVERLYKPIII